MILINAKTKIAKNNLKVYKVFKKVKNVISLPFKKINNSKLNNLKFVVKTISEKPGYHCFGSFDLAEKYKEIFRDDSLFRYDYEDFVIIEMEIPKGTEYMIGIIDTQYIGNGMKAISTPKLINPKLVIGKVITTSLKTKEIKL